MIIKTPLSILHNNVSIIAEDNDTRVVKRIENKNQK